MEARARSDRSTSCSASARRAWARAKSGAAWTACSRRRLARSIATFAQRSHAALVSLEGGVWRPMGQHARRAPPSGDRERDRRRCRAHRPAAFGFGGRAPPLRHAEARRMLEGINEIANRAVPVGGVPRQSAQ